MIAGDNGAAMILWDTKWIVGFKSFPIQKPDFTGGKHTKANAC